MSPIMEASIPAEKLALGRALRTVPDATFEILRDVSTGRNDGMSVLAARNGTKDEIESGLQWDTSIKTVEPLFSLDNEMLYRVQWALETETMLATMFQEHGIVLRAVAQDGSWRFRVMFPDRDSVSTCYENCCELGIRFDIKSICDLDGPTEKQQSGLSQKQYETLKTALECGFFEIPREVTLEELADEFNISHQALSERLRRAQRIVVANTVSVELQPAILA